MKKTIVGIMTIVAMIVAILGTNVNAATLGASAKQVKAGEEVTVSVTTNNPMKSVQYEIVYNPNYFEPVVENGEIKVTPDAGLETNGASLQPAAGSDKRNVLVSAFGKKAGKTTSVKFKALKDTEAAEFSVVGTEFCEDGMNPVEETVGNTVAVKIGEDAAEPTTTPDPEVTATPAPEEPEATVTATPAPEKKNEGKVTLPQTGAPVYAYVAGIALVVIVAGAILAVRKNK